MNVIIEDDKDYVAAKLSILRIEDLTLGEKVLLLRIASFKEYFESAEHCAKVMGFTAGTVRKMKRILEGKGYITTIANNGRGKRYVTRPEFQLTKKEEETEGLPTSKIDTSMLKPVKPQRRERNDAWTRWKKQYADLIPALDACTNYLSRRGIPLLDPAKLRKQLTIVSDTFRDPEDPTAHIRIITTYIAYLESDAYLYQVEHTKYCPVINSQDDLFGKFSAIRDFKRTPSRHYDPNKVLTH